MKLEKYNNVTSFMIAFGLILFIWHNPYQPFIEYIFLPWIGLLLLILGELLVITNSWKELTMGSKWVWIPLLVIALSIGVSGLGVVGVKEQLSSVAMGAVFFGLYPVSRYLGRRIYKPFIWAVVIECASIIIYGATHNWMRTGGLLSPTNYDIATGFLFVSVLVSSYKHQWWLATISVISLYVAGSAEALFCTFIMVIAMMIRKDWDKKAWIMLSIVAVCVIITFATGIDKILLWQTYDKVEYLQAGEPLERTLNRVYDLHPLRFFGYGLNITEFYETIPHNIVLIIIEQAGFIPVIAWFVVSLYLAIKTRWHYLWIAFISLGVWDHFIWTQAAPYFWVLCGVSSLNDIGSDLIFRSIDAQSNRD
jgi:hypothetical protein